MLYLDSGKQEHGEVWIRPPRKIDGAIYINNCSTIFIDFKASKIDSRGAKYIYIVFYFDNQKCIFIENKTDFLFLLKEIVKIKH